MKMVRFNNKKKIFCAIVLTLLLVVSISSRLSVKIAYRAENYLVARVSKENTLILKEAFSYLVKEEVDMNKLINVVKNSKEEIVEVNFDIKECTLILSNITGYINGNLENYNFLGYKLEVPIGMASGNPLFMNLGPRIPIKVELSDIALGNVRTKVRDFGINSALVEVYLEVSLDSKIIYPFDTLEDKTEYEALISSIVIQGVVPSFYNGVINSKSDIISLPINE